MIEFLLIGIIILLCPALQRLLGALILFVLAAWAYAAVPANGFARAPMSCPGGTRLPTR